MHLPRLRSLLRTTAVGFGIATLLVLVAGLLWPLGVGSDVVGPNPSSKNQQIRQPASEIPGLSEFGRLWGKQLRRPLVDQPARSNVAPAKKVPFSYSLVGTVVEPERSMAIFTNKQGEVEMKGIGERLGNPSAGSQVLEIEPQQVVVQHLGRPLTLKIEPE